jgi:hypothetical protein
VTRPARALPEISAPRALAWRLRRHGLAERPEVVGPAEIAGRRCGLHAQVMGSAELSVLARTGHLPRTAVADALWRDRSLVKMWAARGTLHLLPAAELGMWLGALGTLPKFGNNGNAEPFVRPVHLPKVFRPAGRIAPVVLAGGRIAGRWTHRTERREVHLSVIPFEPMARRGRAILAEEAGRIADHLARPLRLTWDEA